MDKVRFTCLELTQPLEWHWHRVLEARPDWVEDLLRSTDVSKEQEQFIAKKGPSQEYKSADHSYHIHGLKVTLLFLYI